MTLTSRHKLNICQSTTTFGFLINLPDQEFRFGNECSIDIQNVHVMLFLTNIRKYLTVWNIKMEIHRKFALVSFQFLIPYQATYALSLRVLGYGEE